MSWLRRRLLLVIAALLTLSTGGLFVISARATSSERWIHFATEDRNIECVTSDSLADNVGLDCVMRSSGYDPTAAEETKYHPHWILFRNGVALKGITRRGLGRPNPATILRNGQTLTVGNFRCSARGSHLTCVSRFSRHGFFLSQGRQRTW
jgi:hypothetical protein